MKKFIYLIGAILFSTPIFGQGFSTTATNWNTPSGGQIDGGLAQGFIYTADWNVSNEDTGSQSWDYMDINGDGKTDLVVTSQASSPGVLQVFSSGTPYWKVYLNTGSGFAGSATNWSLPAGGQIDDGVAQGFIRTFDNIVANEDEGSQVWNCMDMNADGLPDLVVTSRLSAGSLQVYSSGGAFWKVYLNTGTGFSSSAINWATPSGGQIQNGLAQGFIMPSDNNPANEDEGSQGWSCMDMDADGKPDLVVTSRISAGSLQVYSSGGAFWKVYLNTGSGFASSATNWATPSGGQIQNGLAQGFIQSSDNNAANEDEGSQVWSCMDMDADEKPDLVVTSRLSAGNLQVYSSGGAFWKVYLNTGNGFSSTPTNWTTPSGGQIKDGLAQGFIQSSDYIAASENEGSQVWSCMDMNADGKPDLVVTSRLSSGTLQVYSSGGAFWKVYLNSGSGFASSPTNWTTPSGGQIQNGLAQGFIQSSDNNPANEDEGSQAWSCADINGDGTADLIVSSRISSGVLQVFSGGGPFWKVFLNTTDVGIDELENGFSKLEIYPNPFQDGFTLKTESDLISKNYTIMNSQGQTISKGKITGELTTVNLEKSAKGIYFIQLEDRKGCLKISKL